MWKISILSLLILAIPSEGNKSPKQKVCIVGAGPAGLIATKYVAQHLDEFELITFDKQSNVGGMWIYTDSTTVDEHGLPVHSSLYKYLKINGPKEFLSYPDYTMFTAGNGSFVYHSLVLEYLKNYTNYFNLRKYIQFDTNVEKVSLIHGDKWLVNIRNLNTNEKDEILCDIFIAGSGHHVKGNIPKIPGIESFPGRVLHSHLFRKPEEFAGQTVVVLGAGLSGFDISIQISWNASMVYLSSRHDKLPSILPENVVQVAGIASANGNELILNDGTRIKADALLFATGYLYDLPYLDENTGIIVEDGKYVRFLYKQFISIEHPTMAILNIPTPSYGFIMPHAQMQYFLAVLRGKLTLPSREKMLEEEKLPPGKPKSKAHFMIEEMFSYYDGLALAGGGDPLPDYFEPGFWLFYNELLRDPTHYREKNLYIYNNGKVVEFC
ncbi:uncharacterized protein LOC131671001 isoform X2 [Phymastichus coffea]|nr:uncharacterized protein LOC131671001 isoform X2 [Phymastichus coffea]XP_058803077.1 uncharacterized protein LOC131671001 isoform X2 [Phymastichus coffea]XP_058803078.1 uncharacterized protein LOC131671001 isoform X2 [Phymastichus coffea]XP_058803079.1 uncharacterized protein LOC131671001 isoform X2 [Phymastichus coffea]XP_058803080.1 uncharacterized protein LOC131671001 isoform X2 [Phymastichus coffea]XP_058803081.1 uncharacterized protein LOC131671001 isoform X2 [Phymastichus coffea]XP_05